MSQQAQLASLAVVVIGRNEGERLTRCLESVGRMKQPFESVETIYVDSNSTDDSIARARRAGARVLVLPPGPTTAARGRNTGWHATRAAFILFLDGDTVLHPDFVATALTQFNDPQTAIVWGHRRELAANSSVYNRVLDLDWIYAPGVSQFCGGDALMRRDVLEEVGGYDESLIAGEEPEMCRRMTGCGYRIMHIDFPMTTHDLAMTSFRQYWKRAFRAGFAYASVSQRFRHSAHPLWRSEVRRNLLQGSLLLIVPPIAALLSLRLRSGIPIAGVASFLVLLLFRTARRTAWKSPTEPFTIFLYGVHSHFQQIPILFGQIKFYRQGKREHGLIEYKEVRR
ncbi:MAG: glycosyltransferase [Candidatus Sulfotelmatobacter sp.]|jgi:cellulose synthase/poly-beta-1,6-N-acetylglucosamine synthase-like glycosyltransferase